MFVPNKQASGAVTIPNLNLSAHATDTNLGASFVLQPGRWRVVLNANAQIDNSVPSSSMALIYRLNQNGGFVPGTGYRGFHQVSGAAQGGGLEQCYWDVSLTAAATMQFQVQKITTSGTPNTTLTAIINGTYEVFPLAFA